MTKSRYPAVWVVILLCALLATLAAYATTHYSKARLLDKLTSQQQQLQRLSTLRMALNNAPAKAASVNSTAIEWQLAQWADQHQVKLALQHDSTELPVFRASITGPATKLRAYLAAFIERNQQQTPQAYTHQLLSWNQPTRSQATIKWHFSAGIASSYLSIPSTAHDPKISECLQVPGKTIPRSINELADLSRLQLTAIVRVRAEGAAAQAYFSNDHGAWLAVQKGDWLGHPISQVIAISDDTVTLRQWQKQQCWSSDTVDLQLKEAS